MSHFGAVEQLTSTSTWSSTLASALHYRFEVHFGQTAYTPTSRVDQYLYLPLDRFLCPSNLFFSCSLHSTRQQLELYQSDKHDQKAPKMVWPPPGNRNDGYWPPSDTYLLRTKTGCRYDLQRLGYKPRSGLSTYDLVQLLRHHWSGHLCYDKCSDEELQRFIRDRGLRCTRKKTGRNARSRLVDHLISADTRRSFTRFSELPAELRVHVYQFYVAEFTPFPFDKTRDPPLTHTSRMLRNECLPIFYRSCTFRIRIKQSRHSAGMRLQNGHSFILRALPKPKLEMIRKLAITFPEHFNIDASDPWTDLVAKLSIRPWPFSSIRIPDKASCILSELCKKGNEAVEAKMVPQTNEVENQQGSETRGPTVLLRFQDKQPELSTFLRNSLLSITRQCVADSGTDAEEVEDEV